MRAIIIQFMKMLEPDVLAFISAKIIIDRITSKNRLQDVAMNAGNAIEDEVRYESFNAAHPALFYKINKETDAAGSDAKRKRTILVAAYNRYCLEWNGWSQNDKLHLGMKMIEIFQQSTGFVEVVETRSAKNKTDKLLVATQTVCALHGEKSWPRTASIACVHANGCATCSMDLTPWWWLSDTPHSPSHAHQNC